MLEIRCSQLARPMSCAGSLFFTDLPEQESNEPAREGTAAGEVFRAFLETNKPPTSHMASNGYPFNSDMEFHTRPIAHEILARARSQVLCETRIDWQTRSGIWIRGQYDAAYVGPDGFLYIDDLKYGFGIVEPKGNWQLLGYAIGEVIRRGVAFEYIVMRIHQPRPHHEDGPTREWRLSYSELLEWKEKIEDRMFQIAGGLKDVVTGPQCKYCPAAGEKCPAFNRAFYRGIEYSYEFLQDSINEQELSFQLDLVNRTNEVLKTKLDSLKALAISRMKEGKIIPNYTSEPSYGDRKWKPGFSPETIKVMTGIDIVEKTMLSPAKAEKLIGSKDFVNALVDRPFLGQRLVRKDAGAEAEKIFGNKQKGNK